ncbi:DUF1223 domain-containing protein [Rhodoplanes elegans]|uniref:DUF1223 domain-containing protein n=1 Tax=Rhodoplanes elegans TaxID=29408 RepID=UPI0019115459|nr:DUF1223 domain-containing protein [Rhodoplanes elegans]
MRTRRARWTGGLVLGLIGSGLVIAPARAQSSVPTPAPTAQAPAAQAPAAQAPATRSLATPPPAATSAPQLSSAQSSPALPASLSGQIRGVVELFTSQGCSSCPAADRVLAELKKDPTLVAVSLPITYWDYLGWKDTLADPRHTARQTAYSQARGDRSVYTPQVVVNGTVHALGSDRTAIEAAVTRGRARGIAMSVPVRVSVADGKVSVSTEGARPAVAAGTGAPVPATTGEVWLLGVTSAVEVAVGRGENQGRTIVYNNVVRRWVKLGDWTGAQRTWSVPVADLRSERISEKIDAVAVLIQGGSAKAPGAIYGAAFERLH